MLLEPNKVVSSCANLCAREREREREADRHPVSHPGGPVARALSQLGSFSLKKSIQCRVL